MVYEMRASVREIKLEGAMDFCITKLSFFISLVNEVNNVVLVIKLVTL